MESEVFGMKEKIRSFFSGRQGMDELSKLLFWAALGLFALGVLCVLWAPWLSSLLTSIALMSLLISFMRAFSRRLELREAENQLWLRFLEKKKAEHAAAKDRRAQKDYRFFKCPNCHTWVRVPRGKGKVHINCKCGYILYRKT